jgi:hypothetical protein
MSTHNNNVTLLISVAITIVVVEFLGALTLMNFFSIFLAANSFNEIFSFSANLSTKCHSKLNLDVCDSDDQQIY